MLGGISWSQTNDSSMNEMSRLIWPQETPPPHPRGRQTPLETLIYSFLLRLLKIKLLNNDLFIYYFFYLL